MKKLYLVISLLITPALFFAWEDSSPQSPSLSVSPVKMRFLEKKIALFIKDLESHDLGRLVYYFSMPHVMGNVESFMGDSFLYSDNDLNTIITQWGFMFQGAQVSQIKQIKKVKSYSINETDIVFELELTNGKTAKAVTMIDWETLTFFGASG